MYSIFVSSINRVAFTVALVTTLAWHAIPMVVAESDEGTTKLTRDLDKKNEALAEEEAEILNSLIEKKDKNVETLKKELAQTKEDADRASVDLRKVADTIAHTEEEQVSETTEAVKEEAKASAVEAAERTVKPGRFEKATFEAEQKEKVVPAPVQKVIVKEVPVAVTKPEVTRELPKKSDQRLRQEVDSMGNLFTQWQAEFEAKHADAMKSQEHLAQTVETRLGKLERADEESEALRRQILAEERQAWSDEKLTYLNAQNKLEGRIEKLEKGERKSRDGVISPDKEITRINAELSKHEESIKSLRLADGQLKARMATSEGQVNEGMKEVSGMKLAVDRLESNLTELSQQFQDSLKYRPHAVYDALEASDYVYDWGEPGPRYTSLPHNAAMSNMPIVTVAEENANLWSGPGEDDKIITTIRRGGRLAVEVVEKDWYRVILADGRRAWIPARSVIHNNPVGKDTTLRIASSN